jgi:hypothetical protein
MSAPEFAEGTRQGYFEQLELKCALGFYRDNAESLKPLVEMQQSLEGIFLWESNTMEHLMKANIPGAATIVDKQLNMVSYLAEVCYELCLLPDDNMSQSQGYKALIGKSCSRN